ncbi:MAG: Uma2 family endonuclease [Planctomycetota bacterium]
MHPMQALFTVQDWKRLPEGFRAQLLDGCLLREAAPTYGHQDLVGKIYLHLVQTLGRPRVVLAPTDVVIDRLNVLQPDVCVLRAVPARQRHDVGIPRLAFEVLSPATRRVDRTVKALKWLSAGVEEVWLVDPQTRTITVRTIRGATVCRAADAACSEVLPAVRLVPRDLFAEETGEPRGETT